LDEILPQRQIKSPQQIFSIHSCTKEMSFKSIYDFSS
jgi:hypothetical protein